ncbi:metallophosphoesterase family protein [Pontiella agarivorans]|uniref:Metallophosphoesterase n=1 Tax=Pontiella agarivorans TaxID=3038953 RepID=A0ABU5N0P1_9BACT|nr:metallophosphoesterase [Pontiella agarivorans]MDZ8120000.1 metallophosphoesterase [Pontiella agarivorans]
MNRCQFIGTLSVHGIAMTSMAAARASEAPASPGKALIASPPVVQNPRAAGLGISLAVSGLATAWVEYGFEKDNLAFTAVASQHGLVAADDRVLHIRVNHSEAFPTHTPIYYRVVAQPLHYKNAYKLERGEPQSTPVYALRLPDPNAQNIRVVSINDTHENAETLRRLNTQIEALQPDVLIWNGDTCNDFNGNDAPEQILLNPVNDLSMAWAATRPLLYSNGNHDVRGERAREIVKIFSPCPESTELPYNQALRFGPLALVILDTGEDKPDRHPVFAGTAAYEPYRENQAVWLKGVLQQEEIRNAPFKVAVCHIPLRGLEGQPDGTTLKGYARYSGFGARLWLPQLKAAGFQGIISGHTHVARHDMPTTDMPVHQFIGGGPKPEQATLTLIDAQLINDQASMLIQITDLHGRVLFKQSFAEASWLNQKHGI